MQNNASSTTRTSPTSVQSSSEQPQLSDLESSAQVKAQSHLTHEPPILESLQGLSTTPIQDNVNALNRSKSKSVLEAICPSRPLRIKDLIKMRHEASKDEVSVFMQSIPKIRRASNQEHFRCLADETKWQRLTVFIPDGEFKEYYFVASSMEEMLSLVTRIIRLVPCITLEGIVFFWPLNVSESSNSWNDSARIIAGEATTKWIRMASNKRHKVYEASTPKIPKPEPVWPDEEALDKLLDIATEGRIIDSVDHPIIAKLF